MKSFLLVLVLLSFGYAKAADVDHSKAHQGQEFHHEGAAVMQKMNDEMKAMKSTESADKDFAAMMAKHHEGAIEMSQAYLKYGKDEDLRKMATKMIEDQKREVEMLKAKF